MDAYSQYIIDLYEYLYNDNNIALMENNKILSIENLLAPSSYSVEELQDPILNYNRISVNELSEKHVLIGDYIQIHQVLQRQMKLL